MTSAGAEAAVLLIERSSEGFAVLTLNRPARLNALSAQLRADFVVAIDELERDPRVLVLILTGAGRAFCAGLDLNELGRDISGMRSGGVDDPVAAMARFSGPIIGAINGPAITGGLEIAVACDVLIASDNAVFADTHSRVGVMPGWGLSQMMSRLVGLHRAKELAFTGNFLHAAQAERWGLVNRVVPAKELLDTARALARDMIGAAPGMLVTYKALIDDGFALAYGSARSLEREVADARNVLITANDLGSRSDDVRTRGRSLAADTKS